MKAVVNPYGRIHRGLRRVLANLSVAAGAVDPEEPAEVLVLAAQARKALALLDSHARHEDTFIHPLIAGRLPFYVERLEAQHDELDGIASRVEAACGAFAGAPSAYTADALYQTLCSLLAAHLQHMHEEEALLPVLRESFTEEELGAAHARLLASLTPEEKLVSLELMLPAIAPAEREELLRELQAGVPAQAFAMILSVAHRVLGPRQSAALRQRLARPRAA